MLITQNLKKIVFILILLFYCEFSNQNNIWIIWYFKLAKLVKTNDHHQSTTTLYPEN
jgi:hypothetical protein